LLPADNRVILPERTAVIENVLLSAGEELLEGGNTMKKCVIMAMGLVLVFAAFSGCTTAYKAKPLSFKAPSAYPNHTVVAGATVGARAFVSKEEAMQAFGFDIRGAGMLPVQVVFDNQGPVALEIDAAQTFLEDDEGNLWPILSSEIAYERATKFAETNEIFKSGAYHGFLGATAGAIIGAAIGIVSGENVGRAIGKGAVIGGAAGATLGGVDKYGSSTARRSIIQDLRQKSLEYRPIPPKGLSYGFLFFPGEAKSAKMLRLKIMEGRHGPVHVLNLNFY
jgi:hypothetical protein